MSSLGASIAYLYVSLISYNKCKSKGSKVIAIAGIGISILFILLLLLPMSPAALSKEAMVMLMIWCILGFVCYPRKK